MRTRVLGLLSELSWVVFLVWTLGVSFLGLVVEAVNCDDGCHSGPGLAGHWTLLEDAWQWDAFRYLAIAHLVAGVFVLGEPFVGARMTVLVATYGIQAAFALALAALTLDGERYDIGPLMALLIVAAAAGPLAIGLTAADRRRPAPSST
jgi:K+ transporter